MNPPEIYDREEHLEALATETGCTLHLLEPRGSWGVEDSFFVGPFAVAACADWVASSFGLYLEDGSNAVIPAWDGSLLAYFIGLHELGHSALHAAGPRKKRADWVLREETEAWRWAFQHTKEAPSARILHRVFSFLDSYLESFNLTEHTTVTALRAEMGVAVTC